MFTMRRMVEDPELMGKQLVGESWQKQKILLIASEGEPLTDEVAAIYAQMSGGRVYVPGIRPDEVWFCKGRRVAARMPPQSNVSMSLCIWRRYQRSPRAGRTRLYSACQ